MGTEPRPKEFDLYSDGTYDWLWDEEGWHVWSPAPYGMPSYPERDRLKRVVTTYVPLTDDDFNG